MHFSLSAAANSELHVTLKDEHLQALLKKIEGSANREKARLAQCCMCTHANIIAANTVWQCIHERCANAKGLGQGPGRGAAQRQRADLRRLGLAARACRSLPKRWRTRTSERLPTR